MLQEPSKHSLPYPKNESKFSRNIGTSRHVRRKTLQKPATAFPRGSKRCLTVARKCRLDIFRNECNMASRDTNPPAPNPREPKEVPQEIKHEGQDSTFSSQGDTTLIEYDPATADMDEVNRVIAEYEAKTGAQPFDIATGERIDKVTRAQNEVLMVHPIAGG